MPGVMRDLAAEREPEGTKEPAPTLAHILKQAWLALDGDPSAAKREIHRALELLSNAPVQAEAQADLHRGPRCGLAPWQMQRVTRYIRANLETPIRVEDMAGVTQLSKSYFFRAFKRSFGMPPHAYVIILRLARARELLTQSDDQITQIAAACGFADQAHFSRAFRREAGCAPSTWRRERRGSYTPDRTITVSNRFQS